jgi:hypothetical protein
MPYEHVVVVRQRPWCDWSVCGACVRVGLLEQTDVVSRIRINHMYPPYDAVMVEAGSKDAHDRETVNDALEARYQNAQLILLAIAHVSVAKSAADVYACVEESPGRRVMADNPDVVCFEGVWTRCVQCAASVHAEKAFITWLCAPQNW